MSSSGDGQDDVPGDAMPGRTGFRRAAPGTRGRLGRLRRFGRFGWPGWSACPAQLRPLPGRADRYDRWAATYDASAMQHFVHQPVHDAVLDLAEQLCAADRAGPGPRRILDVGCGTGRLLAGAGDRFPGAHRVGLDPSAPMLAHGRRASGGAALMLARAEQLPLRDGTFDLVLCTMALLRCTDPPGVLAELARVAAPGAPVLLADVFEEAPARPGARGRAERRLAGALARSGLELAEVRRAPLVLCGVTVLIARRPAASRRLAALSAGAG